MTSILGAGITTAQAADHSRDTCSGLEEWAECLRLLPVTVNTKEDDSFGGEKYQCSLGRLPQSAVTLEARVEPYKSARHD